jgi:hypothetical protein
MKMGRIHCLETISGSTQPRRESPNKDINLIPDLKLSPTRTTKQETTQHRTGHTNHTIAENGWPG